MKTFESHRYSQRDAGATAADLDFTQNKLQISVGILRDWDKQLSGLNVELITSVQALDFVFSAVDKLGDRLVKLPKLGRAQALDSGSVTSPAAPSFMQAIASAPGPTEAASGSADAGIAQHTQEEAQIDEMVLDSRESEADFDRTVREWL